MFVMCAEKVLRLAEIESDPLLGVLSTLRVPLDGERALAVLALRGRAADLTNLAGQLGDESQIHVGNEAAELVSGEAANKQLDHRPADFRAGALHLSRSVPWPA